MAKQKLVTSQKMSQNRPTRQKLQLKPLHARRLSWFAVLAVGLVIIQFAYNIHVDGRPQILGYATSITIEELLANTNTYRRSAGLEPLKLSEGLSRGAQAKAEDMIAKNYWSHIAPNGTTPWYFFDKVSYPYKEAGENLAYGFHTSGEVVTAWMNSAEHRANILGSYRDIGFGYANGASYQQGNNTVIVAFYGEPQVGLPLVTSTPGTTQPISPVAHISDNATHVNGLAVIANGTAPWATYASLALVGASMLGFLATHLELLRMGWHATKKYAALHPIIDAIALSLVLFLIVRAAGGFIQ